MRNADYAIACAVLAVVIGCALALVAQPKQATAREDWEWRTDPRDVTNQRVLDEMQLDRMKTWLDDGFGRIWTRLDEIEAERIADEEAQAYYEQQAYYAPSYGHGGIYRAEYSDAYNTDGPSRTMPGWHDGYLETYYNASGHYLASTWTLDSEGFYHDENGRYVVGVEISHKDEMPYGTVVDTGKGEGVVYDYGSGAEVHDFATNW